jgi:hypothetical protein
MGKKVLLVSPELMANLCIEGRHFERGALTVTEGLPPDDKLRLVESYYNRKLRDFAMVFDHPDWPDEKPIPFIVVAYRITFANAPVGGVLWYVQEKLNAGQKIFRSGTVNQLYIHALKLQDRIDELEGKK